MSIGGTDISTQEAVGVQERVYAAARDKGDSLEAARAVLAKITLLSGTSLAREAAKESHRADEAALLQNIKQWAEDESLSADEVAERALVVSAALTDRREGAVGEILKDALGLDLAGFKSALESDRDGTIADLASATRLASTSSSTQALSLKDLMNQRTILMTLSNELTDLIRGLKTSLNERA